MQSFVEERLDTSSVESTLYAAPAYESSLSINVIASLIAKATFVS